MSYRQNVLILTKHDFHNDKNYTKLKILLLISICKIIIKIDDVIVNLYIQIDQNYYRIRVYRPINVLF